MSTVAITYWKFIDPELSLLCDPRIAITRHLEWTNLSRKDSTWSGPEPDNYNFAIFDQRPHDLKFIKDQVWYKIDDMYRRTPITGWMSVYYIPEPEQQTEFRRAIIRLQPQAFWYNAKSQPLRTKRKLLERENHHKSRSDTNFNTEERLWQMGYFENLKLKYFDGDERFIKVLGTPRGVVLNYQPEVDSNEVEDY